MTDPFPAVIIAGGTARRMGGGHKALLPLGQARVIDHLLMRLRPQVGAVAINANDGAAPWAALDLPILPDPVPDRPGPLAGLLAAMLWAADTGAGQVVTVAADTPFLPPDFVARLGAAGTCAIAATQGPDGTPRPHPVCGLWPVSAAAPLREMLAQGERRVMRFCATAGALSILFADTVPSPFFNINTPDDLAEAERLVSRR